MTDLMLLFRYKLMDSTKMICDESIEKWDEVHGTQAPDEKRDGIPPSRVANSSERGVNDPPRG